MPTWSINSTDSFHYLNCIYILLHIHETVIKETLQFASSLEYLFLFSRPSTPMEVFPIMRFLSCKRWGLHRKNSVGCVFIRKRPIKEELSRSKTVALWRVSITFAPLRKWWSVNPGPLLTLSSAHQHWGSLGPTLLLFLLGLHSKPHCVTETHVNKRVEGRNRCRVLQ